MGKPALGKGMQDLLNKNVGMVKREGPKDDKNGSLEQLKLNISRYQAQGYDVSLLNKLEGKGPREIIKGIEDFRDAVKQLSGAQTTIRSLEGYGYTKEIEKINSMIKDPSQGPQKNQTNDVFAQDLEGGETPAIHITGRENRPDKNGCQEQGRYGTVN